jgi:hypothetical protein
MKRRRSSANIEEAQMIRLAWWASFFATVALIAALGLARSAQAITVPTGEPLAAAAILEPEEEEESEDEEESESAECEFAEDEGEEAADECEAEGEEGEAEAPRECVLSSASATVSTSTRSDKVQLAIRYTSYRPGAIQVAYFLRGKKGSLILGRDRTHLGVHGVIRDTNTLTPAQMTKALAAKDFTIQLRPTNAPSYCNRLLDRHLTVRHNSAGRLTWSDPGPSSTASRQG